jgi:hypothetical protein
MSIEAYLRPLSVIGRARLKRYRTSEERDFGGTIERFGTLGGDSKRAQVLRERSSAPDVAWHLPPRGRLRVPPYLIAIKEFPGQGARTSSSAPK